MEKAVLFLREKGVNHAFKIEGGNFDGSILDLLREYEKSRDNLPCNHVPKDSNRKHTVCLECGKALQMKP